MAIATKPEESLLNHSLLDAGDDLEPLPLETAMIQFNDSELSLEWDASSFHNDMLEFYNLRKCPHLDNHLCYIQQACNLILSPSSLSTKMTPLAWVHKLSSSAAIGMAAIVLFEDTQKIHLFKLIIFIAHSGVPSPLKQGQSHPQRISVQSKSRVQL
jgi:hypothetical protein